MHIWTGSNPNLHWMSPPGDSAPARSSGQMGRLGPRFGRIGPYRQHLSAMATDVLAHYLGRFIGPKAAISAIAGVTARPQPRSAPSP